MFLFTNPKGDIVEFFKKIVCSLFLLTGHLAFADLAMTDENGQTTLIFVVGDSVVIRECAEEMDFSDSNTQNRANCTPRVGTSDLGISVQDFEGMIEASGLAPMLESILGMPVQQTSSTFSGPGDTAKVSAALEKMGLFLASHFTELVDLIAASASGAPMPADTLDLDRSSTPEYFGNVASFSEDLVGDKKFNALSWDEQRVLIDELLMAVDFATEMNNIRNQRTGARLPTNLTEEQKEAVKQISAYMVGSAVFSMTLKYIKNGEGLVSIRK